MKNITIIGGGVIGLTSAYYLQKEGYDVTIIDKGNITDSCSFGNMGYISPSHFVPLASPGIISQGLKWMLSSTSPFYIKPRLDIDLMKAFMDFQMTQTFVPEFAQEIVTSNPTLHHSTMTAKI